MTAAHVVVVLTLASLVWAAGAVARLILGRARGGRGALFEALLAFAALAGAALLSVWTKPGVNPVAALLTRPGARDLETLCAAALGVCFGLLGILVARPNRGATGPEPTLRLEGWLGAAAFLGCWSSLALFAAQDQIRLLISGRGVADVLSDPRETFVAPGFEIRLFHEFNDERPIQLAVGPNGAVYVCYAEGFGGVTRLVEDPESGAVSSTLFAGSLGFVNGLAFHGSDLFVSRSGRYTIAPEGRIDEADTGAITVLRDLDGDGEADYYRDVVTGLPGAQAPDPVHQNNGLVITAEGRMFIGVGAHSNSGPNLGELDGTIATALVDGSDLRVYASGMRNPFDCAVGPEEELFCTDNDIGYSDRDELNHVRPGLHYGHPYMTPNLEPPAGSEEPIWVHRGGSLQGVAYADSSALPAELRGSLLVASYASGEIHKVDLKRVGDRFEAETSLFARAPGALDVAAAANGDIYVSCYTSGRIYRIRPK